MPFGLMEGLAIADTGGGLLQPLFGHLTNVKNRKFTREMYERQRRDALADWSMQNEYNSPRAQMQRFQEAGLNPALIYGQTNTAAPVRSSSASGGGAEAPRFGNGMSSLLAYQSVKQSKAQTDNLNEINENLKVERDLKRAQIAQIITSTNLTEVQKQNLLFDLGVKTDLRSTTIEGAKAGVEELRARIESTRGHLKATLDENERRAVMFQPNFTKALEEIATIRLGRLKTRVEMDEMRARIENLKQDNRIKKFDEQLVKDGIRPGDPIWYRLLAEMADNLFPDKDKKWDRLIYDSKGNRYGQKNRGAGGKW